MTIGAEIQSIREGQGMTRSALAQKVSKLSVSHTKEADVEGWETGRFLPFGDEWKALAYALDPHPEALLTRWTRMQQEEVEKRAQQNAQSDSNAALPSVPAPVMDKAIPAPTMADPSASGNVDLFLSDGNETLRFDGVGVEEAVRRFRDFLTWQILPDGGHAVFVSCVEYPRKGSE